MAAIWVLFSMQSVLLRLPLQGWVNAHKLTERALVYGSKFGSRGGRNAPGRTNDVDYNLEGV
jgi:hypothetical protein